MKIKLKCCEGCKKDRVIYKRIEGKPYCKECSFRFTAPPKIKKRSAKKIIEDKEYSILRKLYLERIPTCEINSINCTQQAVEIHHKEYRGINTNNIETWAAVCRACHNWIHEHQIESRELGYLK